MEYNLAQVEIFTDPYRSFLHAQHVDPPASLESCFGSLRDKDTHEVRSLAHARQISITSRNEKPPFKINAYHLTPTGIETVHQLIDAGTIQQDRMHTFHGKPYPVIGHATYDEDRVLAAVGSEVLELLREHPGLSYGTVNGETYEVIRGIRPFKRDNKVFPLIWIMVNGQSMEVNADFFRICAPSSPNPFSI